jgi:hypothetical protein
VVVGIAQEDKQLVVQSVLGVPCWPALVKGELQDSPGLICHEAKVYKQSSTENVGMSIRYSQRQDIVAVVAPDPGVNCIRHVWLKFSPRLQVTGTGYLTDMEIEKIRAN